MLDELFLGAVQLRVGYADADHPPAIQAFWQGHRIGELAVTKGAPVHERLRGYWVITHVDVTVDFRRRGVSAKMRAEALRIACAEGKTLVSDTVRSGFEAAFWEDLRTKGQVDILDLRTGQLGNVYDDDGTAEQDDEEAMYEQQDYDYVYVMRCPNVAR